MNYVFHGLSGGDIVIKYNISLKPDILRLLHEKSIMKTARYLPADLKSFRLTRTIILFNI